MTIKTVREKIAENVQLRDGDPRKILGKVREMCCFPSSTQSEPVNLPDEQGTLEQRVERFLDVDKNRPWEIQTKTTEASGVRNLFSSLELNRLGAMFKEMITTSVPISKPMVKGKRKMGEKNSYKKPR